MISRDSIVVATQEQVSCDLAGEVVILHLRSGMHYGLDAVGARIWSLIQTPMNVNDLRDALLEEYDVDPDRCERDLVALLEDITAQGLIEVRNATTA
jgi:Coenzyme PQQ synthesis protein D (PqqD)